MKGGGSNRYLEESETRKRCGLFRGCDGWVNPFFPWSGRDLGLFYKFPVDLSITSHHKEVADCRTYIDARILIAVRARLFALKHIRPVIDCEWTNVLPLRIGNFSFVMNRDPPIVTNGDPGASVNLPEPWDN